MNKQAAFELELTQLLEKYTTTHLHGTGVLLSVESKLALTESLLIIAQKTIKELNSRLEVATSSKKVLNLVKKLDDLLLEAEVSEDPVFMKNFKFKITTLKCSINDIARDLT